MGCRLAPHFLFLCLSSEPCPDATLRKFALIFRGGTLIPQSILAFPKGFWTILVAFGVKILANNQEIFRVVGSTHPWGCGTVKYQM
jgi:hypothetical protein